MNTIIFHWGKAKALIFSMIFIVKTFELEYLSTGMPENPYMHSPQSALTSRILTLVFWDFHATNTVGGHNP